jgi:hypothetical protein
MPCLGTALRAGVAAQALRDYRAVPALGTINRASDRARAVLFRVVPRAANRVRPIWNSIRQREVGGRVDVERVRHPCPYL